MLEFVVKCDDYIQRIENISNQHDHDIQKLSKKSTSELCRACMKILVSRFTNTPSKLRARPILRRCGRSSKSYTTLKTASLQVRLPSAIARNVPRSSAEFEDGQVRHRQPTRKEALYVLVNTELLAHDLVQCRRAPPMFRLYGQEPDACAACRSPDHHKVDYDVNHPDTVLQRGIEVHINDVQSDKKTTYR